MNSSAALSNSCAASGLVDVTYGNWNYAEEFPPLQKVMNLPALASPNSEACTPTDGGTPQVSPTGTVLFTPSSPDCYGC